LEQEQGSAAWSRSFEQGSGWSPRETQVSILLFALLGSFVCLFVELHYTRYAAAQLHEAALCVARKEEQEEGDGSNAVAFFLFFVLQVEPRCNVAS
jgi:hypothetical protein